MQRETPSVVDLQRLLKAESGARVLKRTHWHPRTHKIQGSSSSQPEEFEVYDALKLSVAATKSKPSSTAGQIDSTPILTV